VVSIITTIFVLWLFFSELALFLRADVDPQLFVDTERSEKIRINLDVHFHAIPCAYLTLDAMDMAGELQLDLAHNVFKKRLKDGVPIGVVREELSRRAPADTASSSAAPSPSGATSAQNSSSVPGAVSVPGAAGGAVQCGSCYGAQTAAQQCCNTCEEVREAYRVRGWAFSNPEGIHQCVGEGFVKTLEEARGEGCQVYGYLLVNKACCV
jgi:hypothetical protein